ncbi:MAG: AtpZ/AtpI family protein [Eubacteriales bacterium]|nr:AtpZ/AtpI family protein [Eubacteriales bacterium]MDD3199996.1 AtpZ/AtpI family protein [Eubacteriales bacterium]MDD4121266.1 AtpZ/AtpI family protein [Eubacteriales bacterium]MDD4629981.1 AtpZ/AtpI family protein [Eubacteriales bacterium]
MSKTKIEDERLSEDEKKSENEKNNESGKNGESEKNNKPIYAGAFVAITFISQLGMTIITPIVLGVLAGNWLDNKLGTGNIFFGIFFVLGIAGAVFGVYKLITVIWKKMD